jgi:Papain-like cysteine protease AvrRpt2
VFAFRGEWTDLRLHIAKGRPLIAGLKPKGAPAHYVAIVGCQSEGTAVLVNDPESGKLVQIERPECENVWRGTDNWTLLAVPNHSE